MKQIQYILIALLCVPLFAQQTYVPDDNFEAYLEANGMGNGIANDDSVTTANINTVETLNVIGLGITSMTGLKDFTALIYLDCRNNQLTSLNLSANTALTELDCSGNPLTSLDLSANTALTELDCSGNPLTSLDLSANTALTELDCGSNPLTSLDLSSNTALTQLICNANQLTSLDLSANTALIILYCNANQLTSLDVSSNTALSYLWCHSNQLTSLDVSSNTALIYLNCYSNQLTSLDVRNGNNTIITYFISTGNPDLTCIDVDDISWSTANWTNIDSWTSFNENCLGQTYVPDDNFEAFLETHDALGNVVTIGDSSSMGNGIAHDDTVMTANINTVETLNVSGLGITSMTGLEDFTALTELWCYSNPLTGLDVSSNTALTELWCYDNQLTSLALSSNTALTELLCYDNQLTNLDLSSNTALTQLICNANQLTSLDLSANTALSYLNCYSNQLTGLDLSANTALITLYCNANQLPSLDLSANTALSYLICSSNQLTNLDVRNGNNQNIQAGDFYAQNNPNLICIDVDNPTWSDFAWTEIDSWTSFSADCATMPVEEEPILVTEFKLHEPYPNPFNPRTTLKYDLPDDATVTIIIYDLMGRKIKTLVNAEQSAGFKSVVWDATNELGQPVSAGMYLYRINALQQNGGQAGDFHQVKKMVLLK